MYKNNFFLFLLVSTIALGMKPDSIDPTLCAASLGLVATVNCKPDDRYHPVGFFDMGGGKICLCFCLNMRVVPVLQPQAVQENNFCSESILHLSELKNNE